MVEGDGPEPGRVRFDCDGRRLEFLLPAKGTAEPTAEFGVLAAQSVVAHVLRRVQPGQLVLHLGAGVGLHAVMLASLSNATVIAFEREPALFELLTENLRYCGVGGVRAYPHERVDEVELGATPGLVMVSSGAAGEARIGAASKVIGQHKPQVVLIADAPAELWPSTNALRTLGYAPRAQMGAAGALLFDHGPPGDLDLAHLVLSAVLAVDWAGRSAGSNQHASTEALRALQKEVATLAAAFDEHARQTRALLDEQLIHARRVDAELFELARRFGRGAPSTASHPAYASKAPGWGPGALRKLRKLAKDPKGFMEDSKSPLVRGLRRRFSP